MAYSLTFWKVVGKDAADQLKEIRLKSVNEVFSLSLPHNRPKDCDAIVLERGDDPMGRSYKGHYDKLVWANEKGRACDCLPSIPYEPTWLAPHSVMNEEQEDARMVRENNKVQIMPNDLRMGEYLTLHEVDGELEIVFISEEGKLWMMTGCKTAALIRQEVSGEWANRLFATLHCEPNWELTTEPLR